MNKVLSIFLVICFGSITAQAEEKWHDLIFQDTLMGWKAAENPDAFTIEDGVITCHGERGHLFYTGPISSADFQNFELRAQVKTEPGSNSGIYFHTSYQETGWPEKGFEVQVNNSSEHENRKTGSLYNISDVLKTNAKDNEWFWMHIIVKDKTVKVFVNEEQIIDFEEPTPPNPPEGNERRILGSGTFALQAHDPDSKVSYKDIKVKILD